MNKKIKSYIELIFGLFLSSLAFNLFLDPYNFVPGGVSGLSMVINEIFKLNDGITILILNIILLIFSYIYLGKEKTRKTILGSILFPVFILLTQNWVNYFHLENIDLLVIAIMGGSLCGLGYGFVYKNGFTSGGTDILNQIMEKKMKIPMAKSIIFIDGFIVILSGFVFGIPSMIYSIIVVVLISELSNITMLELNKNKVFYITTTKPKEIQEFLKVNYFYDVTLLNSKGGIFRKKKKILICSVNKRDYYAIKEGILYIDPKAFVIIANAYEQKNANVLLRKEINYHSRW